MLSGVSATFSIRNDVDSDLVRDAIPEFELGCAPVVLRYETFAIWEDECLT